MSSLKQLSLSHGLEEKANPASLEFVDCDKGFLAGELGLVFCDLGGVSSSFSSSVRFRFLSGSPLPAGVWDFAFWSHTCNRKRIKYNQSVNPKCWWTSMQVLYEGIVQTGKEIVPFSQTCLNFLNVLAMQICKILLLCYFYTITLPFVSLQI